MSRIKHDGSNDNLAIQYCLDVEGIELKDVSLIVQCANFEVPERNQYKDNLDLNLIQAKKMFSALSQLSQS